MSLALALKDILGENYETHIVDPHPPIFHQYYTLAGRYFLKLWGLEYKYTDTEQRALLVHKMLTLSLKRPLQTLIEQVKPSLIITTHTLLSYEIAQAIKQSRAHIPLVFQFSELEVVHSTWLTVKDADAYLVPTREIYAQAQGRRIDEERLHLAGFPVRRQFLQDYTKSRAEMFSTLGLDPAVFTVFLQGGAEGAAHIEQAVKSILTIDKPIQILLAVGTNKQLESLFAGVVNLRAVPFTRTIAPYMAAADVIVGKAGPNFLAEAVMLGKPFLATAFIPGQETPNLAFLQRHNLGWVCLKRDEQAELIAQLVSDPAMVAEKLERMRAYRAWNAEANQKIYPLLEGLILSVLI